MSHTIHALYDAGVFRPLEPVALAEGTQVDVQLSQSSNERPLDETARKAPAMAWRDFLEQTYSSCAGLRLQRHEQGDLEARESFA